MEQVKEVLKKSKVKWIICILGSIVVALLIFQAGIYVGVNKASFSFKMGEQYFRQMNNMPNDNFMGMNRQDFTDSHGSAGKIISIKLPLIVVADKDGVEKTILISTSTEIKQFKDSIKPSDLKINDYIAVIGTPDNNAELEARLIRIMPDPENMPFGQATMANHN
jgi:hypothetical protein